MWPIGHVAGAYILLALYTRTSATRRPSETSVLVLVVASLLPDLIDKPLAWYGGVLPTGRSLGHSLLFIVPLCVLVALVASRYDRQGWAVAFAIGTLSHLLLDALPVLWDDDATAGFLLYPLVPVEAYEEGSPAVTTLLRNSLYEPYFHLEFVLLVVAVIQWRDHGYPGIGPVRDAIRKMQSELRG